MRTFTLGQFPRTPYQVVVILALLLGLFVSLVCAEPNATSKPSIADIIHQAIKSGKIAEKLTDPDEIKAILGEPKSQKTRRSGGKELLYMSYPDVEISFSRFKKAEGPFTLTDIKINDKWIELDEEDLLVLRTTQDLKKLNEFTGLQSVSLKNLDLTEEYDNFKNFNFDSLTQWPGPEKLPPGFNPRKLLEDGKNPGLGIRALHEQGINGQGIGIAILDQPLLLGHEEYTSRLLRYDATRASWLKPQMHGSPIIGIAVGKTCGVAPGAFVFYYAGMTTTVHETQADWIGEIIKHNETVVDVEDIVGWKLPYPKRIRVISISASPEEASNNDAFRKARKRALDAGILVVTCSHKFLDYGTLTLIEGKDPDNPESYKRGRYSGPDSMLLIPTGNKTIATHQGNNVYKYERQGGMSWAAPYLAGLAALAYQVDPEIELETIVKLWKQTAVHTDAGPVVNPKGFIEAVRKHKQNK